MFKNKIMEVLDIVEKQSNTLQMHRVVLCLRIFSRMKTAGISPYN